MKPPEAAALFVERHFPESSTAFVAGSFLRGESTSTSDLDVVVITNREEAPFRASYREFDWPIEAFVHTRQSLSEWFAKDAERGAPSLCFMCSEGITVRDRNGEADGIKREASDFLARGPKPMTGEEIETWRYGITDALEDFIGTESQAEGIFLTVKLATDTAQLILKTRRQWIGYSKWVLRALRRYDAELADRLSAALLAYAREGDKQPLVDFVHEALEPLGGRLFEGYYQSGKNK